MKISYFVDRTMNVSAYKVILSPVYTAYIIKIIIINEYRPNNIIHFSRSFVAAKIVFILLLEYGWSAKFRLAFTFNLIITDLGTVPACLRHKSLFFFPTEINAFARKEKPWNDNDDGRIRKYFPYRIPHRMRSLYFVYGKFNAEIEYYYYYYYIPLWRFHIIGLSPDRKNTKF